MSQAKTIGVFFGSRNPEHDVSIITAQLIISELKKLGKYTVVPVYVSKRGEWYASDELGTLKFFTENNARFEEKLKEMAPCVIDVNAARGTLILKEKSEERGLLGKLGGANKTKEWRIDIAFPAFHGANGEDGTAQGMFELAGIPYIGCDTAASAIAMNKILTKRLYQSAGIATTNFVALTKYEWGKSTECVMNKIGKELSQSCLMENAENRATNLQRPLFVKPARLGSSIGINKAKTARELEHAIEVALHYDEYVIVEESVEHMADITCAVVGNYELTASLVQEAVFVGEHFSYEAKYLEDGGAQLGNAEKNIIIPARLSEERTREVQELSKQIFTLLGCSGIARIDFLHDKEQDKLYANEVNTLPGTLYHHLWKASGITIDQLLERLIALAEDRHREKSKLTSTFQSDILKFANSVKLQMKRD